MTNNVGAGVTPERPGSWTACGLHSFLAWVWPHRQGGNRGSTIYPLGWHRLLRHLSSHISGSNGPGLRADEGGGERIGRSVHTGVMDSMDVHLCAGPTSRVAMGVQWEPLATFGC